jgi:hypothetical protein
MLKKIVLGSMLFSSSLFSNAVFLDINNDTLEVGADINLNGIYALNENSDYSLSVSYLKSEIDTINSNLLSVGAKAINPYLNDNGLSLGLGVKLVRADFDKISENFMAIPLSIFASYHYNDAIHADFSFDYAPNVLALSDAKGYQGFNLKGYYELIDNGYAYIGYRQIEAEYDVAGKQDFDDSIFFGYKVKF